MRCAVMLCDDLASHNVQDDASEDSDGQQEKATVAICMHTALSTQEATSPDPRALSSCPGRNRRGPRACPSMIADMPFFVWCCANAASKQIKAFRAPADVQLMDWALSKMVYVDANEVPMHHAPMHHDALLAATPLILM